MQKTGYYRANYFMTNSQHKTKRWSKDFGILFLQMFLIQNKGSRIEIIKTKISPIMYQKSSCHDRKHQRKQIKNCKNKLECTHVYVLFFWHVRTSYPIDDTAAFAYPAGDATKSDARFIFANLVATNIGTWH